jgi:hypothetical protein
VSVLGGARPAPFVGRRTELAALAEAWEQAVSGARHVVLVTGEAGIGKSRLTTEAARRVTAGGGLVLFGRCDPEDVVPYQPLVEALDGVVAEASPQDPPLVGEDALAELAAVLPSLARPRRTASPDRSRLFGAATELVTALARRRPLLLVLDDLQWADDDTLLLVRHLLRRAGDAPLLMVAIARDHDLEPGSALADVVHSLERDGWVRRVPLRGLREPDVRELLVHLRGAGDHAVAARRLLAETAGNPFLVTELAVAGGAGAPDDDAPARAGAVPVSSGDAGTPGRTPQGIPPGVRDLVTNRLARLTPATVDLLRAGAVAGGRFDLDIAGAAAGLDDRELVDAADAALASGVVVEETADRYRFPHDVVRRSLVDGLSGARRRMLHRRTADAIERLRAHDLDAHASALARHTAAGSDPAGDERAVRWARRASALAAQRSAPAEAARLCHQALAHVPPGRGDLEAEATTDLGIALLAAGDDAGTRALAEGADLARRHHRPDVLRRAALALADAADDRPELRTAAADLVAVALDAEPAPRVAAETDDAAVERACLLARLHRLSGDTGGRRGAAGGTTAGLTDVGAAKAPLADALLALRDRLGRLAGPDHLDERQRLADDLAVLADAADDPASRVVASSERAMAAAIGGDGEGMHAALDEVRVVVEAHGDPVGEALLAEHAVARLTTVGRLDQARNALAEALAAIAATAEPATVEHRHRTVIDWLGGAEMPASAASATRAGRAGPAGLVGPSAAASAGDEHLHDLGVAAIAACDAGDVAAAAEVRSRLAPYTDRICSVGFRTFVGAASFHLGRLAALAGDWSEAERHLLSALRLHSACRSLPWVALTQAALADVLEVRGRPSDREWIAGLRAESEWVTSTLGLRTL